MRISDWSSDVCSSDLGGVPGDVFDYFTINGKSFPETQPIRVKEGDVIRLRMFGAGGGFHSIHIHGHVFQIVFKAGHELPRSEEHTSELQSLMRNSYAVFCLKNKKRYNKTQQTNSYIHNFNHNTI